MKFIIYTSICAIFLVILYGCVAPKTIVVTNIGETRITQEIDDPSLLEACKNWKLSKHDVSEIISLVHEISPFEQNEYYYNIPCEINGQIAKDGASFHYNINAGATLSLLSEDTKYTYYGCSDAQCSRYFLAMPDTPPASGR